jgi:cation transport protein ChaC
LGLAYEVSEADWPQTYAYLQRRELITMVYKELELPVTLVGDDEAVPALAYVVDRDHPQCACGLTDPQVTALVHQGQGEAGGNLDYVRNTHRHLQSMGFTDPALERIISLLGGDAT